MGLVEVILLILMAIHSLVYSAGGWRFWTIQLKLSSVHEVLLITLKYKYSFIMHTKLLLLLIN